MDLQVLQVQRNVNLLLQVIRIDGRYAVVSSENDSSVGKLCRAPVREIVPSDSVGGFVVGESPRFAEPYPESGEAAHPDVSLVVLLYGGDIFAWGTLYGFDGLGGGIIPQQSRSVGTDPDEAFAVLVYASGYEEISSEHFLESLFVDERMMFKGFGVEYLDVRRMGSDEHSDRGVVHQGNLVVSSGGEYRDSLQ